MGLASVNLVNSMGANGCKYINDNNDHTGPFTSIQFTRPSSIEALSGPMENVSSFLADAQSFAQGQVIYMPIQSIRLVTGGAAILYKGSV
jgi:hypothetical protein